MLGRTLFFMRIFNLPEHIKNKGITDTISMSFCKRIIDLFKEKGILSKASVFYISDSIYFTVTIKLSRDEVEFLLQFYNIIQALQSIYKVNADTFFLVNIYDSLSEEELVFSIDFLRKLSPGKYKNLKGANGGLVFYNVFYEEYKRVLKIFELIRNENFIMYLQPVVDVKRNVVFYEALARLESYEKIYFSNDFFEILENSDYYSYFEAWLYEEAIKWVRRLGKPISVNITGSIYFDIKNSLFLNYYCSNELIYEISEKAVIQDAENLKEMLNELHKKGVKIYLDDFGSGISGVYLLKEFPISAIKIDKSFSTLDDPKVYAIVKNLVNLSKDMQIKTCMEGIEKEEHFNVAKKVGIDLFQGYLFSKPMEAEKFLKTEGVYNIYGKAINTM